ncbi:hypothetical protein C8R45DRAFT_1178591 [Mycena sanguinolenta]|nr:hypothetical protein C8R45DRAFT_1178591 [Mycena sanguinolenta]
MSMQLTFADKKLLDTAIIAPDRGVHYTTTTTSGFRGRKITTIAAASGLVGFINWREKLFVINGVQKQWSHIKSHTGGLFSSEHDWNWGSRPFKLKYQDSHKELIATPVVGNVADIVRFTTYHSHMFHDSERAMIYFPYQMQDEIERMFLLMAILETEIHRQDTNEQAGNIGVVQALAA